MSIKRSAPLDVAIRSGRLEITIGIDVLAHAVLAGPVGDQIPNLTITNAQAFAQAVMHELTAESETGTTVVHRMLDKAGMDAIDHGAEGVETT